MKEQARTIDNNFSTKSSSRSGIPPSGLNSNHDKEKIMRRMMVLLTGVVLLSVCAAASAQGGDLANPENNLVNGAVPPEDTECLADKVDDRIDKVDLEWDGDKAILSFELKGGGVQHFLIIPGRREAGSRAPVHTHPNGGSTCVLQGKMSLYLEGKVDDKGKSVPATSVGGDPPGTVQCYHMPADTEGNFEVKMAGVNEGDIDALIIDIFPVPEGFEPPGKFKPLCVIQNEGLPKSGCYVTGAGCEESEESGD